MKMYLSITGVLVTLLIATAHNGASAETLERVGLAYDKQSGTFLYSEIHHEVKENGRLARATVTYRDAGGKAFAAKHINFRRSLVMPEFQLVDSGNGHVEGVLRGDAKLEVHFRPLSDASVQRASVEMPINGIIDAGFDRFIEQNWEALVAGQVLERQFLIPSQLDFYTFEIEKIEEKDAAELTFELRIKSIFLQMLVSPVLVSYDARTRSLLRYEGISNIRDESGQNFDVRIEFPRSGRVQVEAPLGETAPRLTSTESL